MTTDSNTTSYEHTLALITAIISQSENKRARANLYKEIKTAQFFVAAYSLPLPVVHGTARHEPHKVDDVTKIPLYTAVGADGSKALLAYLDTETLNKHCKDAFIITLSGAELLNLVHLQAHLAAVVLNTTAGWIGIPQTDVRFLLKGYAP